MLSVSFRSFGFCPARKASYSDRFIPSYNPVPTGVKPSFSSQTALADSNSPVERGVSVDQDGKSNVWAIEPKMEVSSKSNEEKTNSALVAGGGFAAFAVLAGFILTNLPDPNQF